MSRRSALSTTSPFRFAFGEGIYAEDLQDVAEMVTYAGAANPQHLAGCAAGPASWGPSGSEPEAHGVVVTGSAVTEYRFWVYVDPSTVNLRCSIRMAVPGSTTYRTTFNIGAGSLNLDASHGGGGLANVYVTNSIATSSTGTGLLECSIVVQRTAGSGTAGGLRAWHLRELEIGDGELVAPVSPLLPFTLSADFDGAGDSIEYGSVADTDGVASATWSAWVYMPTLDVGHLLRRQDGSNAWSLGTVGTGANLRVEIRSGGSSRLIDTNVAPLSAATWHHVCAVYRSSGLTFYVDGVVAGSTVTIGPVPATLPTQTSDTLMVNNQAGGSSGFAGRISNAAYWAGTAATAGQVAEIYNSGSPPDLRRLATLAPPSWWAPLSGSWAPVIGAGAASVQGAPTFVSSVP